MAHTRPARQSQRSAPGARYRLFTLALTLGLLVGACRLGGGGGHATPTISRAAATTRTAASAQTAAAPSPAAQASAPTSPISGCPAPTGFTDAGVQIGLARTFPVGAAISFG